MRILVTGVRGKTGREVARQLAGPANDRRREPNQHEPLDHEPIQHEPIQHELLGGTADPSSLTVAGVVPVMFDWESPSTWPAALDGVDAVYLVRPEMETAADRVRAVVTATPPEAHVVFLSELGADGLADDAWPARVERAVTEHTRPWTLLRPSWFMQVFTDPRFYRDEIVMRGRIALPAGDEGISWVDTRDIAAVAVRALVEPGHAGRSYAPTGPRAVPLAETAGLLAAAAERQVEHDDVSVAEAVDGLDPWTAEILAGVYQRVVDGDFAMVTSDVERVTGQPARTLEAFVDEHAAGWRPAIATEPAPTGPRR